MISFFKHVFNSTDSKVSSTNPMSENRIILYFNREKTSSLEISIQKDHSCQDVHSTYHDDILTELIKCNSGGRKSVGSILNTNEYGFFIIDDNNPYTELKLKMIDHPVNFLTSRDSNLYYLTINVCEIQKLEEDSVKIFQDQDQSRLGLTANANETTDSIANHEILEPIREGELMKYSAKQRIFTKRTVLLDKDKLILTKPKSNETKIIPLVDISSIPKASVSNRSSTEKYIFEIVTYEGEHCILKAKNDQDMVTWIEAISNLVQRKRENQILTKYSEQMTKSVKDSYEKATKIVHNGFSLIGLLSMKETRYLLYQCYKNQQVCDVMECVINYKINMYYLKYFEAWTNFEEVVNLLHIESFDLSHYSSLTGVGGLSASKRLNVKRGSANDEKWMVNCSSVKRKSAREIKERQVLFTNKSKGMTRADVVKYNHTNSDAKQKHSLDIISTSETLPISLVNNSKAFMLYSLTCKIISYDTLKYFQELKVEMKDLAEKSQIENPKMVPLMGMNIPLQDYLKPDLLDEIYENLIVYFFREFYTKMRKDPVFKLRLENLLQYYFMTRNQFSLSSFLNLEADMTVADHKLIGQVLTKPLSVPNLKSLEEKEMCLTQEELSGIEHIYHQNKEN